MRLYWAKNDGMTGHVWLSPQHVEELDRELAEQGAGRLLELGALRPGARVHPGTVDAVLVRVEGEPRVCGDEKLWRDWLEFLRGAAERGGVLVQ